MGPIVSEAIEQWVLKSLIRLAKDYRPATSPLAQQLAESPPELGKSVPQGGFSDHTTP